MRRDLTQLDPETALAGGCLICTRPLPQPARRKGRRRVVCTDPQCHRDHQALRDTLKAMRQARRCRICRAEIPAGQVWCQAHQTHRDPCVVCGQPARRRVGRGDSRPRCQEHTGKGPSLRTRTQPTGEESA